MDCIADFNPLPHTRENTQTRTERSKKKYFNPLPHTRENLEMAWKTVKYNDISIHSLIRGRTNCGVHSSSSIPNFNPLPHTRENTNLTPQKYINYLFQSTPSYEGERADVEAEMHGDGISIHSLIRGRTLLKWSLRL